MAKVKRNRTKWRTARTSDPLELYELAVQSPDAEVRMVDRVWKHFGRPGLPHSLREDFAGTCAISAEWIRRRATNSALCIDLDPAVLSWARRHHLSKLTPAQRRRITLRRADVCSANGGPVDAIAALNFSYFIHKSRRALVDYFRHIYGQLGPNGVLLLDAYGGADSFLELTERRSLDGFRYLWETLRYNPISGEVHMAIHFEFPDGTALRRAFTYDWRLWSIPEVTEALAEAGFRRSVTFWEGTDRRTGSGNGHFRPSTRGEACEGWVAYIAAAR